LSRAHIPVLRRFSKTDLLVALDYDGTLAPLAPTPERARMRATTRRLLMRVARLYPVVVISGRALADVSAHIGDAGVQQIFGNHGLEWSGGSSRPQAQVRRWIEPLHEGLDGLAGVMIEDKMHSISVHFRRAPDQQLALQRILPVVARLRGVRVICGAVSVNLLPKGGADKGVALLRAVKASGCDTALYAGDDDTDEDAFDPLPADSLLSIRIQSSPDTRARYYLESQREIDGLLRALIDART
jgi:trehalose 6-phosphate phosphatase